MLVSGGFILSVKYLLNRKNSLFSVLSFLRLVVHLVDL